MIASSTPAVVALLGGTAGRLLASVLVLVAVAAFIYAATSLVVPHGPKLAPALAPYVPAADERHGASRHIPLAQTPLTRRAVDVTGRFARRWKVLPAVEGLLERANLPLRPAEALFFHLAGVATATLLGLIIWRTTLAALGCLLVTALLPLGVVRMAAARRRRAFAAQLPDALRMLAGSLRSGRSLLQGLQGVAAEAEDPLGHELRRVLAEARLGRPIEDALGDAAGRMASADCQFAVTAVRIQRQVGGNLAELLSRVAETMVLRERLRGEAKALTAEGRVSAIVLGLLPVGLGLSMWAFDPEYVSVLFRDPLGQSMLAGAVVLAVAGFFWMRKTVDLEI